MPPVATLISCPKCRAVLGAQMFNQPDSTPCPVCDRRLIVEVFPALFRRETSTPAELVTAPGDASCFYHENKKAAVVCDACGRFICALCDLEMHGQHLCPACLEAGHTKGRLEKILPNRTRHDKIALGLAVLPLLIFYFTLLTAPAALYLAIRHWNCPGSVAPSRPRLNLIFAILFATLEIIAWVVVIILIITQKR